MPNSQYIENLKYQICRLSIKGELDGDDLVLRFNNKKTTISLAGLGGDVDLPNYYTKTEVDNKGYLTNASLTNYVTTSALSTALNPYALSSSLSNYATTASLTGYVDRTTAQDIAGAKTFSGTTRFTDAISLSNNKSINFFDLGGTSRRYKYCY